LNELAVLTAGCICCPCSKLPRACKAHCYNL